MKPKAEDIVVIDADQAMTRFRALLGKLVRVPKKALKSKLARDKRRKAASKG
ncbi:MAG: hypothetical protein ABSF71_24075 [Terriglobia bacterium]|jgi:hypothetical protein